MNTKQKLLIAELLKKHALTPQNEVNMRAWHYFVAEAEADKKWANGLAITQEWLESACDYSIETAERYRNTPTLVLAAQHYGYSHYRGHATSKAWGASIPLDTQAKQLWDSFEIEHGLGYGSPIVEA